MQFHEFHKEREDFSSPNVIVSQFAKVIEEGLFSLLFFAFPIQLSIILKVTPLLTDISYNICFIIRRQISCVCLKHI